MKEIRKLFKDILTGIDGESYDIGRVMYLASSCIYFLIGIGTLWDATAWTPTDFANGVCIMAVGFGAHLRLKQPTEPGEPIPPSQTDMKL